MEAQSKMGGKEREVRKTTISDLGSDELSCILRFVAESGAKNLARALAISRLFRDLGKEMAVLKAVTFNELEISMKDVRKFQQMNNLVYLAAQAKNPTAEFKLAKIIMMSSRQLEYIENGFEQGQLFNDEDQRPQALAFMDQFYFKESGNKGVYPSHYQFVRKVLGQCSVRDFVDIFYYLLDYVVYSGMVRVEAREILNTEKMLSASGDLKRVQNWEKLANELGVGVSDYIIKRKEQFNVYMRENRGISLGELFDLCYIAGLSAKGKSIAEDIQEKIDEFEALRVKTIQILDEAYLVGLRNL